MPQMGEAEPTAESLLDDIHEQIKREANERIMALIALSLSKEVDHEN